VSRRVLLPVMGVFGGSLVFGLVFGPIGAALLGNDPFIPVPHVELAPPTLFTIGAFHVTNTLLSAWLTTIVVLLLFIGGTRKMRLIPGRLQSVLEMLIEALYGFVTGVVGERFGRPFFPILATIFIFVAFNAWMALLPIYQVVGFKAEGSEYITTHLLRSAATDINMPMALAIIAFLFIEIWGFKVQKFGYFKEFIRLGNPIQLFIGLLEIISHLSRLVSFTFRLFGNMLAGEIILLMITFLLIFTAPLAFYMLEILVGGVQALVFMGLTLVFALLAVSPHEGEHEEHDGAAAH
jgi:F-type H+-transporting ATPase subunit a